MAARSMSSRTAFSMLSVMVSPVGKETIVRVFRRGRARSGSLRERVGEEGETLAEGFHGDQAQTLLLADRFEETFARADDDGKNDQPQLVGEVVLDQCADQLIAGIDQNLAM